MNDENKKRKDSKLLFLEKAIWKAGSEIISVLLTDEHGRRHRVAHIFLEKNREDKKKSFVTCDAKGETIISPSDNLYDVKKKIIEMEPELKAKLRAQQLEHGRKKDDKNKGIDR